jgi:putative salt-induced outer membrane protein
MIDAAIASGDKKAVEMMMRFARETNGHAAAELDRIQADWDRHLAQSEESHRRERQEMLAAAGLLDNWKGQVELGASRATGRSSNLGLYGAIGFDREGVKWRHKLSARADLQRNRGITSTKRVIASWQPNYAFEKRLYAYGLSQFEYDPIQRYHGRYTLGGGLGYDLLTAPTARLAVEGGPAFRHTDRIDRPSQSVLASRASVNFSWTIGPELELKQTGAVYYEGGDSSANALTTLDARILGPVKARFSYDLRYESRRELADNSLDTLSRVTLVYSF